MALGSRSVTFKSTGEAATEAGAGTETAGEVPGEDATTATATDFPPPVASLTEFKPELKDVKEKIGLLFAHGVRF